MDQTVSFGRPASYVLRFGPTPCQTSAPLSKWPRKKASLATGTRKVVPMTRAITQPALAASASGGNAGWYPPRTRLPSEIRAQKGPTNVAIRCHAAWPGMPRLMTSGYGGGGERWRETAWHAATTSNENAPPEQGGALLAFCLTKDQRMKSSAASSRRYSTPEMPKSELFSP